MGKRLNESRIKEKAIEQYLRSKIRAIGGECYKLSAEYDKGIPDRLVVLPNGKIRFIETKRPKGGVLSDMQRYKIKKLQNLKCVVRVLSTYEAVDEFVKECQNDLQSA